MTVLPDYNEFETKEKLINFKPRIKLNHDINTLYNANLRPVVKGSYINFNLCLKNRQCKCKPSLFLSPGTQEQFLVLEINIHLFALKIKIAIEVSFQILYVFLSTLFMQLANSDLDLCYS